MSKTSQNVTLVILAAGLGSRYKGLKQLDGFGPARETIMDYTLYDAIRIGFNKVVLVIRKELETQFRKLYVDKLKSKIAVEIVFQELDNLPGNRRASGNRLKPWGTGHALLTCKDVIHEPFVMVNADDLYGRSALQAMHQYMLKIDEKAICVSGYSLRKTLSSNGGVSRGLCKVDPSFNLLSIEEAVDLKEAEGGITGKVKGSSDYGSFSDEQLVSMNLIGMTPDLFQPLEAAFERFLIASFQDPNAEYYIPDFINGQIGLINVEVLTNESTWLGVTYREDKILLQENLAELVAKGTYPRPLWR